ncbi:unnamed protein product [Paramecium sonneborni]|uniref:Uncharacterized protein n=1 Tax=Paramecium sonneborni TaxID=65129 RepID=A0A8S1RTM0_9CILI|nr:unnamed protein product [Paramecium sonneborni]
MNQIDYHNFHNQLGDLKNFVTIILIENIHEKPWISLGIFRNDQMIKYEHSDAGLSYTNIKIKTLRTFQELWEKNEEIHNKSEQHQGIREFREFKDISEEDVIVTIEYCTNCNEHMGSIIQYEAHYLSYAQALKNEIISRFPIVKLILKLLIYDHYDHSIDTMFLQRRLVQVMSKQKGQIKQAVIGSKFSTKARPQTQVIINKLPQHFKKVSFNIDLKFVDSDEKLKNIDVIIQPYRPVNQNLKAVCPITCKDLKVQRHDQNLLILILQDNHKDVQKNQKRILHIKQKEQIKKVESLQKMFLQMFMKLLQKKLMTF